jgi:signal transduction histidine kinase
LFLLVGCQTAIAVLLVLTAVRATSTIAGHYRHMYDFQAQALAAIAAALQQATMMGPQSDMSGLQAFYERYREDWETASSTTPDAIRFRRDLETAKEWSLVQAETEAVRDLARSLRDRDFGRIRADLAVLYDVNLRYADFEKHDVMAKNATCRTQLLLIGISGAALTFFLGLGVRRAVAPRIKRMVARVRAFQQSGRHDPIADPGKDDIAVLANALDAGFAAIVSRERDREQFIAIAAHELKTPVTSILGFSSLLVNHPEHVENLPRIAEIIHRQSWRLSRLIEAAFLALRARAGNLGFEPKPFNMSALVQRVLQEIEPFLSRSTFSAHIQDNIPILGDEALLEHGLWSLFTCAAALAPLKNSVDVFFDAVGPRARLAVDLKQCDVPVPEIRELFIPFRFLQYETARGMRSAIGLYLCREIVQLHNGRMLVQETSEQDPEFLVELPI